MVVRDPGPWWARGSVRPREGRPLSSTPSAPGSGVTYDLLGQRLKFGVTYDLLQKETGNGFATGVEAR